MFVIRVQDALGAGWTYLRAASGNYRVFNTDFILAIWFPDWDVAQDFKRRYCPEGEVLDAHLAFALHGSQGAENDPF